MFDVGRAYAEHKEEYDKKENEWRRIMNLVSRSSATALRHDFATRNLGTKVDQNSRITKNLGNGMVNDVSGDGRFSKRDLFNSDLDSDEVEKISNFILHLSSANMKNGRSLMEYSGYIYDFNHAPDMNHHIDNITDGKGDGFEILHKYDLKNLTDEEREKISKVADGSSDRIAGVLARYGYAERVHDGGSIVSENSGTMESNDGLDSGQLSEQSNIQGRERESGRNSEENTSVDQQRYSLTHETDDQRKAREAIDEWIAREVQPIIDRNSEREAKEPKSSAKEILGTIASKKDWGEEG